MMTSHRGSPHRKALGLSTEVSNLSIDPYAGFLTQSSERKYQARLAERGLPAHGAPDRGHPFELQRHTISGKLPTWQWNSSSGVRRYVNTLAYVTPSNNLTSVHNGGSYNPIPYKESALDAFAQQAYNRSAPSSVVFDAGQFLGELREGLPNMSFQAFKNSAEFFRSLGSGYLGVEFGWKPFINDLIKAAKALGGATELLSNQGERVHRKYSQPTFSDAGTQTTIGGLDHYYGHSGVLLPDHQRALTGAAWFSSGSGSSILAESSMTKTRSVTRWFEGEFTSFYPLNFDPTNYFERLNQLVSVKLDPATLWELAPWSWMVDWFLRIGDSIEANQKASNDLLIMHYGYAMEHSVYTTQYSWKPAGEIPSVYSGHPTSGVLFVSTEYKRRLRANPYGFRVGTLGSLSGSQLAILGALGLTKIK
jgi:hypothetical protein